MENTNDVNGTSSPVNSEVVKPQDQLPEVPVVTPITGETPAPGSKTPEANLLAALHEERRLRKELEERLNNTTNSSDEVYSDEGKMLAERIARLEAREKAIEDERENERVANQFPVLKEHSVEFIEFQKDFPRHKLENVAKIFLADKGLLDPTRQGLEKPTGGSKTPPTSDMTKEEVKNLRETNYKLYKEKLMKGLIKV